jgi:glycosyltransferase involved in cell wall biosynthesis
MMSINQNDQLVLSVIMPLRNEEGNIATLLDQLCAQTLNPNSYEVIIVDGMSEDRTVELVNGFSNKLTNLRVFSNPRFISSVARNIGAEHSRAPYILFLDGHCQLMSNDFLAEIVSAFQRGEICLSRPQPFLTENVSSFRKAAAFARNSTLGHYAGSKIYLMNCCHCNPVSAGCGYQRHIYLELGGMDESFDACEDLEFNLRVHRRGIEAFHSKAFAVWYLPRKNLFTLFRQLYRYGYGRAKTAKKHPGNVSTLALLLSGFVSVFLLFPLVSHFVAFPSWAWVVLYGGYALAIGLIATYLAAIHGWNLLGWIFLCYPAIHFGCGLGYLSGLINGPSLNHSPRRKRSESRQT